MRIGNRDEGEKKVVIHSCRRGSGEEFPAVPSAVVSGRGLEQPFLGTGYDGSHAASNKTWRVEGRVVGLIGRGFYVIINV